MPKLITIKALADNYTYIYSYEKNKAFAVDPSQGKPILEKAKEKDLEITDILITHHHYDHTAGIAQIKKTFGAKTLGCGDLVDRQIKYNEEITLGTCKIKVIASPGHSRDSVCYYLQNNNDKIIFTGDTLFIGGCGGVFGGTTETMWNSLMKLAALPNDTIVCPGHDYTKENFEFALNFEPKNKNVKKRLKQYQESAQNNEPFLSTIEDEKQTNIFLRSGDDSIKTALDMKNAETVEVFARLRKEKDMF